MTEPAKPEPAKPEPSQIDHSAEEAAIQTCVRAFYDRARADDLLGPVFDGWIKDWAQHLKMMDDFWSGGCWEPNVTPPPPSRLISSSR